MPGSILPFCSCLPLPWVVTFGCLCVTMLLIPPLEVWAQGAVVPARPQAQPELGHRALADPECLCLSWWHCNLLPAWRSRQLTQHWVSFMSVMRSCLSFWSEHKAIAPQWLCWVHPTDALLMQNITTGGKDFQQAWFIYRLTKCRPQGWILM